MDAITNMKLKIIKDFDILLKRLNIGYQDDYSSILDKITFIQTYPSLDKIDPIYEYLINN